MTETAIKIEGNKLNPDALVELFKLDFANINPSLTPLYFTNSPMEGLSAILWKGNSYQYFPFTFSNIVQKATGEGIEPATLTVSNVHRVLISAILSAGSIIGSTITRTRTFYKFTDNGSNPNPLAHYPEEEFIIIQKTKQNRVILEYKLTSILDLPNAQLPARQMLRNSNNPDNVFPGIAKTRLR